MASRNPDFAALSEAAYEAAEDAMKHLEYCRECSEGPVCEAATSLLGEYQHKKEKALQAIRGKKK